MQVVGRKWQQYVHAVVDRGKMEVAAGLWLSGVWQSEPQFELPMLSISFLWSWTDGSLLIYGHEDGDRNHLTLCHHRLQ